MTERVCLLLHAALQPCLTLLSLVLALHLANTALDMALLRMPTGPGLPSLHHLSSMQNMGPSAPAPSCAMFSSGAATRTPPMPHPGVCMFLAQAVAPYMGPPVSVQMHAGGSFSPAMQYLPGTSMCACVRACMFAVCVPVCE